MRMGLHSAVETVAWRWLVYGDNDRAFDFKCASLSMPTNIQRHG